MESASRSTGFSQLNRPAHRCLRSTLQATPHDVTCKTRGQDGIATPFPVGLFHPLQHAGLSRRSLKNRYSAGLATVTDLLRAEDAEGQCQSSYWHAVYGNAVAYAELLYAQGPLTPDAAEELQ